MSKVTTPKSHHLFNLSLLLLVITTPVNSGIVGDSLNAGSSCNGTDIFSFLGINLYYIAFCKQMDTPIKVIQLDAALQTGSIWGTAPTELVNLAKGSLRYGSPSVIGTFPGGGPTGYYFN